MLVFLIRRVLFMIPTIIAISIISFAIIQLPPGDFLTSYVAGLRQQGENVDDSELASLRARYGLGQPVYVQYGKWVSGILLRGDWGQSMEWQKPVKDLIWERLGLTMVLSLSALLVSWFIAIPIGVYSATHQYSWLDYLMTTFSFVGLGTPGFLLALIILFIVQSQFGINVGGLFSDEYVLAPWNWDKVVDMLKHLWVPMLILAVNTGPAIRDQGTRGLRQPRETPRRDRGAPRGYCARRACPVPGGCCWSWGCCRPF